MRSKIFKFVVLAVIFCLFFTMAPEVRILLILIDAIGFDTFVLLCEVQIVAFFYTYFGQHFAAFFKRINKRLEKIDPYYFIPSKNMIQEFPPIIFHAVPFLMTGIILCYLGTTIYA